MLSRKVGIPKVLFLVDIFVGRYSRFYNKVY